MKGTAEGAIEGKRRRIGDREGAGEVTAEDKVVKG